MYTGQPWPPGPGQDRQLSSLQPASLSQAHAACEGEDKTWGAGGLRLGALTQSPAVLDGKCTGSWDISGSRVYGEPLKLPPLFFAQ